MNTVDLSLPAGWIIEPSDNPDVRYYFWKEFPDGMVVDVHVIAFRDQYRVTTQPWHRLIDTPKSVVATLPTLDEALAMAYQKCREWDEHGAKIAQEYKNTHRRY